MKSLQNDNGDAKEKGFQKNRTKMQHAIMKKWNKIVFGVRTIQTTQNLVISPCFVEEHKFTKTQNACAKPSVYSKITSAANYLFYQ